MSSNLNLLRCIRNVQTPCLKIDEIDTWANSLNNEILSAIHININSLRSNWDLLCVIINNLLPKLDLLVLTEINVKDEESLAYQLRNFSQFSKCRICRRGGGIMVFYKDTYTLVDTNPYSLDEAENLNFQLKHNETNIVFLVLAIYRSPKQNLGRFLTDFEFFLKNGIKKDVNLVIIGDLNICTLKKTNLHTRYLNILYDNNILPTITEMTREEININGELTSSCIDHVNIRIKKNIHQLSTTSAVIYEKLADHYFIAFRVFRRDNNVTRKSAVEYIDIIDNKVLQEKIPGVNWFPSEQSNLGESPDVFYSHIVNKFKNLYEISTKRVENKNKSESQSPWINDKVKVEIKKRKILFDRWKRNKNNLLQYEEYKKQRNITTNVIKKEKRIYLFKLFKEAEGDMLKTWRILNDLMDRKLRESLVTKLQKNFSTSDFQSLANNFNDNFIDQIWDIKNKNAGPVLDVNINNYEPHCTTSTMYLRKAQDKDIRLILQKMKKTGKGIDGVRHKDIIQNALIFTPCLTKLINLMIKKAKIPDGLKISTITPLFKKGKPDVLSNYRPVGGMPIIEKVLEKYINVQTQKYLKINHIIPDFQHGFQSEKSTITLLQDFANQINIALDRRLCVVIILLDLSFAFDTCSHARLIDKLNQVGISHPIFQDYFKGRKQITRIGSNLSSERNVDVGLVQGGCNSPTWFSVYTYDVKYIKLKGTLRMFADDSCIVSIHTDVKTAVSNAQEDFINLQKYFYNNDIYLNDKKTEALVLGFKSKRMEMNNYRIYCHSRQCLANNSYEIYCTCHQIEYKDCVKYLGVHIDSDFKMKHHVTNLCKKIRIVKYKIQKIGADKLPLSTRKTLYFSLIDSLLRYGVTLYSFCPLYVLNPLNSLQRNILRFLFKNIDVHSLTIDELNHYVLLITNFHVPEYRNLNEQPYSLRIQRFSRTQVFTNLYGNRILEYLMPTLLNKYCHDFLEESNKARLKYKIKDSILLNRSQ